MGSLRSGMAIAAAALLAACSPGESAAPAGVQAAATNTAAYAHPESGLTVVPLTVSSVNGRQHQFQVEIARTPAEQSRGLMFRAQLGDNEGMIFPRDPPDMASFWMKNTPLPLDIIFVGVDGRIMNIGANTVPYSTTPVAADGLTSLVFEIAGGRAAQLGIAPGDTVSWDAP